jgi:hypothetical protein
VVLIEIKSWSIVFSVKLLLSKFIATMQIVFVKGKGLIVKSRLTRNSGCTLSTLVRMDIFNDKDKKEVMNISKEANSVKTGGDPPIDLSKGFRIRGTPLSFDMLVLYNDNIEKRKPESKE